MLLSVAVLQAIARQRHCWTAVYMLTLHLRQNCSSTRIAARNMAWCVNSPALCISVPRSSANPIQMGDGKFSIDTRGLKRSAESTLSGGASCRIAACLDTHAWCYVAAAAMPAAMQPMLRAK